jgi:hypothetical protein
MGGYGGGVIMSLTGSDSSVSEGRPSKSHVVCVMAT